MCMADSSDDGIDAEDDTGTPSMVSDSAKIYLKQGVRDFAVSGIVIILLAVLMFSYTGLWPPFVSVVSDSMEPNLERGDLVLVVEPDRASAPGGYEHYGIVTHEQGQQTGHTSFGDNGNVILFTPNDGSIEGKEIIHRAMFYVEEGEDWYERADDEYITDYSCDSLNYCPAPNSGFITKGDANGYYDQSRGISGPVPEDDIRGVAKFDVPYLGHVRIILG